MHSVRLGDLSLDPATGELVGPAGRERLDPKVMQVLVVLAAHAGEVVSRQALLEQVWPGVIVGDDAVSRCIYQLRRHLRQAGGEARHAALVETLPKRGYRLAGALPAQPTRDAAATPPRRARWPWAVAAVVVAAAAALGAWHLRRGEPGWSDPLAGARYTRVTDVEGVVPSVAMSRDGAQLAFLAGGGGRLDAWLQRADTGTVRNLTRGRVPGIDNPVRSLGFVPDGTVVTVWNRSVDPAGSESIDTWAVPVSGAMPYPLLDDAAEVDWSPDGTRRVYHPAAPGDPLFVSDPNGTAGRQIHIAPSGVHCHFPTWSPDGRSIYFVQGRPPDEMDVWRIGAQGGEPERVTFHASRVSHPVFVDDTTLLYLATANDGSGPWLHGLDIRRGVPHRVGAGLERYTSLAASADGRRLVATRATARSGVWRVPVRDRVATEADVRRVALPPTGGRAPRLGHDHLLFVSPSDGSGIRRLGTVDQRVVDLWTGRGETVVGAPAIERATGRIAFAVGGARGTRLQVMDADGSGLRTLAPALQVKGAPAWSPDGRAIVIGAGHGDATRLFKVPVDGAPPVPLAAGASRDATWSPDGRFLVFNGADVGPTFGIEALTADGRPRAVPAVQLPRGARRLVFLPGRNALVVLKGGAHHRNFWLVDLDSGDQRALTDFASGFAIGDFDVSADGREIVFDQVREHADVVRIDLAP